MKRSPPALGLIAGLAAAGWVAAQTWNAFAFGDEGLASLRTALNLAARRFAGFNPGERVLTFDHPLWIGLESALIAATVRYAFWIKAASAAAAGGAAFLTAQRAPGFRSCLLLLALPLAGVFREGAAGGLAAPLAMLLLSGLAAGLELERDGRRPERTKLIVSAGALLFLAQFSAAALVLPLAAVRIWRAPAAECWRRLLPAVWPAAAWLGLSWAYYGGVLPHSLHGAPAHHPELTERLRIGLAECLRLLGRFPFAWALIAAAAARTVAGLRPGVRRDFTDWLGWGLCAGLALSFWEGAAGWPADRVVVLAWTALLVLAHDRRTPRGIFLLFLATSVLFFAGDAATPASRGSGPVEPTPGWPSRAAWAREARSMAGPRQIVLAAEPGRAGLDKGPAAYVLDRFALADPFWSARNRAAGAGLEDVAREAAPPRPGATADQIGGAEPLDAIALEVRLLDRPAGTSEPLLSAGEAGDGDVYLVHYLGGHRIQLGIFKARNGVTFTSRVISGVDFSRPHRIEIKYGLGPEPIEWAARSLIVWDGQIVKQITAPFPTRRFAAWELAPGWNTLAAPECAATLSGDILAASSVAGTDLIRRPAREVDLINRVMEVQAKPLDDARAPLPLVVTGHEDAGDALFLRQTGPRQAEVGYGHWGDHALAWGDPFDLDFGRFHEFDVLLLRRGFAGLKTDLAEVRVDGRVVFVTFEDFYPFRPDEVYPLENPILISSCEPKFEGEVRKLTVRPPRLDESPCPPGPWRRLGGETGPLEFTLLFGGAPFAAGQALVETGRTGKGDVVYVVQDDATHYHFGFDHWGIGGATGRPFLLDTAGPHRVRVEMSSLLAPADRNGLAGHTVRVAVDGRTVLEANFACHPAASDELYLAANQLGASTTAMPFQGTILDAHRP